MEGGGVGEMRRRSGRRKNRKRERGKEKALLSLRACNWAVPSREMRVVRRCWQREWEWRVKDGRMKEERGCSLGVSKRRERARTGVRRSLKWGK